MKTLIRFVSCLVITCMILCAFTGCFGSNETVPTQATESDPLKAGGNNNLTAGQVATFFVEALAVGDFDKAVSFTEAAGENSFVFGSDIEWYLPRSSFSEIQKLGFELFKSEVIAREAAGTAECVVTLYDASDSSGSPAKKEFTVKCILNEDNQWVVSAPEFYCTNFLFRAAGGNTIVYINSKLVPVEYCYEALAGPEGLCKDYLIPFIGKRNVEIELKNDAYTYKQTVTPNSDNSISASVTVLKPVDEPEKCFSFVKDTWNALCAKYLVGDIPSCVEDYIAKDAAYDLCNIVWDGFEDIHVGNSSQGGVKNENYNLTICKASSKGGTYWLSDSHIMCYFDYELTWYYNLGKENQSTHQCSSVILSVENGVYKFYAFPDTGLFMEANNYSNEW